MKACPDCGKKFDVSAEVWPRVLGAHRAKIHGVPGAGITAQQRRKKKEMSISAVADTALVPTEARHVCPACGADYKSSSRLTNHVQAQHGVSGIRELRKRMADTKAERKPVVSLEEAIAVLRIEVDTRLDVIQRLESMLKGGKA